MIKGALFSEIWLRDNAKLAFEWDVQNYEKDESDRAEHTRIRSDRKAQLARKSKLVQYMWTYEKPFKRLISFFVTLIMVSN